MKKVFIVVGKSNSRKSSVIRCLSGCRDSKDNWNIATQNSKEDKFFVNVTSPQEKNGVGISPKEFVELLKKAKSENVLTALQSKSSSGQPNGEEYLKALINADFDIQPLIVFDDTVNTQGLNAHMIVGSATNPCNQTAAQIKNIWPII